MAVYLIRLYIELCLIDNYGFLCNLIVVLLTRFTEVTEVDLVTIIQYLLV